VTVTREDAGGLGASVLANVGAFYGNGDCNASSTGTGFGVSWKASTPAQEKYPFEVGLYFAPQISGTGARTSGSVSVINHWTFFKSLGVGVGTQFWEKGDGFRSAEQGPDVYDAGLQHHEQEVSGRNELFAVYSECRFSVYTV
jgi:hypothetical protein